MKPDIHGKQIDVGDSLRSHVEEKIHDINAKYFNHATSSKVTFSREGHGHGLIRVTISYQVGKNIMINAEGQAGDAYAAFDEAAEHAAKRLRRYKKRLRDHHERAEKTPEAEIVKAQDYTLALEAERENAEEQDNAELAHEPVVVAEMTTHIETMSVSDAVMRLDLSGQNALLFRNSKNEELNLIYRRADGNIGWIEPLAGEISKMTKAA
ncbi:MAG: ribosome-associated translation inhibitor RaiA [Alphaproteobacteria bacterium]|nr:ribosome-associated translation inhibitor RaiA [Alphaproteobacteria bacterium]